MSFYRKALGRAGELVAERYLRRLGYVIVERNFECRLGEIDLIALDRGSLVFIEVKTRRSEYESPFEAVGPRKQRQIARVATYYAAKKHLLDRPARFDVVGITWRGPRPQIELVRDAFRAA